MFSNAESRSMVWASLKTASSFGRSQERSMAGGRQGLPSTQRSTPAFWAFLPRRCPWGAPPQRRTTQYGEAGGSGHQDRCQAPEERVIPPGDSEVPGIQFFQQTEPPTLETLRVEVDQGFHPVQRPADEIPARIKLGVPRAADAIDGPEPEFAVDKGGRSRGRGGGIRASRAGGCRRPTPPQSRRRNPAR